MMTMINASLPCLALEESGFAIGPTQLDVAVTQNGTNSTYIYITSYVEGDLIVGMESLPFPIEPKTIPITSADRTRKVELTIHGNASLTSGQYSGKLTLVLYSGNNVAHGVKINTNIIQETTENEPSWLDRLIDVIRQNYVLIIAVASILVALTFGIYIGRKSKKRV